MLFRSSRALDSSLVMPLATAIKLVIDYSSQNSELELPEGVANTFGLVSDIDAVSSYVNNAQSVASESYSQAQSEILSDDNVTGGSQLLADSIVGTFYNASDYSATGKLTFNEDGSGYASYTAIGYPFGWEVDANNINLDYGVSGRVMASYYISNPGGGNSILEETVLISTRINILNQTDTSFLYVKKIGRAHV